MSQLTDEKPRKYRGDTLEPAVRYVRKQREKNNEDARDKKLESRALRSKEVNFSEYYNMSTMTKQVASAKWAEKMARKMIDWAEQNDDAVTLEEFYRSIGMLSQDFCDLAHKYPMLEKALQYTRMIIGDRREKGMITRKYDAGSIAYMMPHYSSSWKEIVAWRSSLKSSEGGTGTVRMQYVIMPAIPNSDLVKELPTQELPTQELPISGDVKNVDTEADIRKTNKTV
jgi:hypothetical protein